MLAPKPIAAWYRNSDRELLRHEAQWTLRWLRSRSGLAFLAAYLILSIAEWIVSSTVFSETDLAGLSSREIAFFAYSTYLPTTLLFLAVIIHLLKRRTMAPLAKRRIARLLRSYPDRNAIWPALLTAPVLWSAAVGAIDYAFSLVGWLWSSLESWQQTGPLSDYITRPSDLLLLIAEWLMRFLLPILRLFVSSIATGVAIGAFASCFTARKGGTVRLALFVLLGYAILGAIPWVDFLQTNQWSRYFARLLQSAFYLLCCGGLYYISLMGLKSDRTWAEWTAPLASGAEDTDDRTPHSPSLISTPHPEPERGLFLGEVRWTVNWLISGPALTFLGIFVILLLARWVFFESIFPFVAAETRTGFMQFLPVALGYVPTFFLYTGVVYLLRRRSIVPFVAGRIGGIEIDRFDRKAIWPALLTAPVLLCAAASLFESALYSAQALMNPSAGIRLSPLPFSEIDFGLLGPSMNLVDWAFYIVPLFIQTIAKFVVTCAAMSAFALICSAPRGGLVRLALSLLLGHTLFGVTFGLSIFFMYNSMEQPEPGFYWSALQSLRVSMFLLYLSLHAGLYFICLKGLRSDLIWSRLLARAEKA